MNQERIGKFIASERKSKKITQAELAEKLGVTDRSVSNWENGKNMPDLSLFKPLCEILDITINELISGERINKKEYQEKLEENILNTIDYSNKKIKKSYKIIKIIIFSIVILMILFISMFFIDVRRMNHNKPVIFSTWGYAYTPALNLHDSEIYLAIREYLVDIGDNDPKHYANEKTFVSMKVYLLEEKEKDSLYYVYAWVVDGRYYLDNGKLKQDTASSIPHKFQVEKRNNKFTVTDSRIPRDGSYYSIDMKNMFPRSVIRDMERNQSDGTFERLNIEVEEQAKLYFHK